MTMPRDHWVGSVNGFSGAWATALALRHLIVDLVRRGRLPPFESLECPTNLSDMCLLHFDNTTEADEWCSLHPCAPRPIAPGA